ncbi:DUF6197 family protein [Streptomyces lavendofoliae]|uniref:DUF6197 family protein n=1 Tax=Streptomyces lavendofoliae TaxID=67314 RepID=UPI003D8A29B7
MDLADVVTVPLTPTLQPPEPCPTLVTTLLQCAHHWRLVLRCPGRRGSRPLPPWAAAAIRAKASGDRGLEADAASRLLYAIRHTFGQHLDSVPSFNDAHGSGRVTMRKLDQAAGLADACGL